jgi:uncharacterized protein (TIGR03000 family)
MKRRCAFLGLLALALACWLCVPAGTAQAHGGGGGHGGGGHGGGGHGGFGHGGGGFGHHGFGGGGFGRGFGYGLGGFGLGGYGLYGLGYGGYGYGGYGGYGYSGLGYGYGGYNAPYYSMPYYSANVPTTGYQSFYPAVDNTRAYIRVHVPADAQVSFDNSPTTEKGTERLFLSPPLEPYAKGYTYQVTARWTQNGKEQSAEQTVRVMPGETSDVNFLNMPERAPQPKQTP